MPSWSDAMNLKNEELAEKLKQFLNNLCCKYLDRGLLSSMLPSVAVTSTFLPVPASTCCSISVN